MSEEPKPSFKLIILGDTGVGKTSLAVRQSRGQFTFQMTPTVGTSHMKTSVQVGEQEVELKIWDTAGQEQFAALVSMYARSAQACIIVGSLTDHVSIENIDTWRDRLHEAGEYPPIIIAINKSDMQEGSPLTPDQIRDDIGGKYPNLFFVSARTGDGVAELFTSAAAEALREFSGGKNGQQTIDIRNGKDSEKKRCC